ncbi:DUF5107 domain-containing protein [Coraliomargarita algicola]|uniref:DUF5107 domain-containing protein n=1 Tax=Coraliomargarita algicola TaxID=3092156 RepID=A0ABZ0RKY0_9BACT|nr:DUF5107 domain-containing protein [Coraliomargarita sp. J2-16]WPJ96722.1 DUF5107 domain-containing protein [Coraliomargarita sp. J2-16]
MNSVKVSVDSVSLPTYPEASAEKLPMFAENRVHQRTSGKPYPNRVVLKTRRAACCEQAYQMIRLENEFLAIEILPELGGRIYSAKDKTTGYDFFYKQSVIKPALIGALGSWVSGGLEFNWPYHHRPSTFMPVDYEIENESDGAITVWLSEHDPIERMKGMVGIRLRPGHAIFETRMQLTNRTAVPRSFLWWENAAVPVNKDYQIFFPTDVSYVNFHYHRSVTTWPKASGVYNGIRLGEDIDIRQHANTKSPTSYFSAASKYDFFGGYDHGKECGVVHVADHHVSPGKKLFTWAYNQLSKTWERALTDTDGEYAELMAGSYTDNQPDFAWLEPYETKKFSQFWYPIHKIGAPIYANTRCALNLDSERATLSILTTASYPAAKVRVSSEGKPRLDTVCELSPAAAITLPIQGQLNGNALRIEVFAQDGKSIARYQSVAKVAEEIPAPWTDIPGPSHFHGAQELHLAGCHVDQYRSPKDLPHVYWEAALQRDPDYAPALIDLGTLHYKQGQYAQARERLEQAKAVLTRHNGNPRSGEVFYMLGLVLKAQGEIDAAYDAFYKASWNEAMRSKAMTQIACIDGIRSEYTSMLEHAEAALEHAADNPLATSLTILAELKLGNKTSALHRIVSARSRDPLQLMLGYLDHLANDLSLAEFIEGLKTAHSQNALDLAFELIGAGFQAEATELLASLNKPADPMVHYTLASLYLEAGDSSETQAAIARGEAINVPHTYPARLEEMAVLRTIIAHSPEHTAKAQYYLACLLYDKSQYIEAAKLWQQSLALDASFAPNYRNLAIAYYSHLDRKSEVLHLLHAALKLSPTDEQLIYETCYVMSKLATAPEERLALLKAHCDPTTTERDDIILEWARALTQSNQPAAALELLNNYHFTPCEGGEHAVVEQYMFAHHLHGRKAFAQGNYAEALQHFRDAQQLPQSLEAGLWSETWLVPHQLFEANCLDALKRHDEARPLYQHILQLEIDYFSNMHLPELPVYQARALQALGKFARAEQILRNCLREWNQALKNSDGGYFGTTPFFISYIEQAEQARSAHFKYLIAKAKAALGDRSSAQTDLTLSQANDPARLHAWIDLKELNA